MAKKKTHGIVINLRLSADQFDNLLRNQLEMTRQEKRIVTRTEMIRIALDKCYPPKNSQMSFI